MMPAPTYSTERLGTVLLRIERGPLAWIPAVLAGAAVLSMCAMLVSTNSYGDGRSGLGVLAGMLYLGTSIASPLAFGWALLKRQFWVLLSLPLVLLAIAPWLLLIVVLVVFEPMPD